MLSRHSWRNAGKPGWAPTAIHPPQPGRWIEVQPTLLLTRGAQEGGYGSTVLLAWVAGGFPFLVVGAFAFHWAYWRHTPSRIVDPLALVVLVGLMLGTALEYGRVGLSVALSRAAAETAAIVAASGVSLIVEWITFGCGGLGAGAARVLGVVAFLVVLGVIHAWYQHKEPEDFPWGRDESDLERLLSIVWGAVSAFLLVIFLTSCLVGRWLLLEVPVVSVFWRWLESLAARGNAVPVVGDDFAGALTLLLGGDDPRTAQCTRPDLQSSSLSDLVNDHMWLGLFFWAVFLSPIILLILRWLTPRDRRTGVVPAWARYQGPFLRVSLMTYNPGAFLVVAGIVTSWLTSDVWGGGFLEIYGTVVAAGVIYLYQAFRAGPLLTRVYEGDRGARTGLAPQMLATALLGVPAFIIVAFIPPGPDTVSLFIAGLLTLYAVLQTAVAVMLLRSVRA